MLLILADMASFRTFKGEEKKLCKICGAAPLPQIKISLKKINPALCKWFREYFARRTSRRVVVPESMRVPTF